MKKELFALLLLLGLITGAYFNLRHLHRFTDELTDRLDSVTAAAESKAWEEAAEGAEEMLELWISSDGYTHIFIRHSEIDTMTDTICGLVAAARGRDAGEFAGCRLSVSERLRSLYGMERLTLGSIL